MLIFRFPPCSRTSQPHALLRLLQMALRRALPLSTNVMFPRVPPLKPRVTPLQLALITSKTTFFDVYSSPHPTLHYGTLTSTGSIEPLTSVAAQNIFAPTLGLAQWTNTPPVGLSTVRLAIGTHTDAMHATLDADNVRRGHMFSPTPRASRLYMPTARTTAVDSGVAGASEARPPPHDEIRTTLAPALSPYRARPTALFWNAAEPGKSPSLVPFPIIAAPR